MSSVEERAKSVFAPLRSYIDPVFDDLHRRIDAACVRIEEIEKRGMKYAGVFEDGRNYEVGDLCTDRGSLWICKHPTQTRPPSKDWQLVQKRHYERTTNHEDV
jgi:hypothetical protein